MDSPDDYDSPWKEAVESYFPEFIEFYFPEASQQSLGARLPLLDQELRAVVQDAELGKRFVDKLAKVALRDGSERWGVCASGSARQRPGGICRADVCLQLPLV